MSTRLGYLCGAVATALTIAWPGSVAWGDEAARVQALAERAAAHVTQVGPDQAFADFSRRNGGFVDGPLYVFCMKADGTVLANGGNPLLVGRPALGFRDASTEEPARVVRRLAGKGGRGWLTYAWPNLATGRIEPKTSYVIDVGHDSLCGVGDFMAPPS